MSAEDLERYETEIELQLYKEYRDVLPMFAYVVETERRFYLTNSVKLDARNEGGQVYFELELTDAWVWDMYRPARFVQHVRVVTFKDVNIEEVAKDALATSQAVHAGRVTSRPSTVVSGWCRTIDGRSAPRARRSRHAGTRRRATRWSTATGGAATASSTSWPPAPGVVVFCEVKTRRGDRSVRRSRR